MRAWPGVAPDLTSLLQLPGAADVQGLVNGRFQRVSGMTRALLGQIVQRQPVLTGVPGWPIPISGTPPRW